MKSCCPKNEEQQASNSVGLPKQISLYPYYNQNVRQLQKQYQVIQKFINALHNLQVAQSQPCNSTKYPFVVQISYNDFVVHFGITQAIINNNCECIFPASNSIVPQCQNQASSQIRKIKLPIYKRREVSLIQDQKDTKNIPKNYCKSIITFACKNEQNLCFQILKDQLKVMKFIDKISQYKKQLLNIKIFSSLLQKSDNPEEEEYRKAFRIISQIFLKKHAINYIFNSKIVQYNWHLKYRQKIYKGVKNPSSFSHIKNL